MSSSEIKTALVVTAAGFGSRMGGGVKKVFRFLKGRPVLAWSMEAFGSAGSFEPIVVTLQPEDIPEAKSLMKNFLFFDQLLFVPGGATRQESVYRGLLALKSFNPSRVMIHDGARPWITPKLIGVIREGMLRHGACVSVLPAHEAMKETGPDGIILRHLPRTGVLAAQTPQAFGFMGILQAHEKAAAEGYFSIDDTDLYNKYIGPVYTVPGDPGNRKITFTHDLEAGMKIGFGWDIHRLVPGRNLILGGITIPFDKGEEGHSDGDALIHALIDALLGAARLGDIGIHFPSADPAYKNIESGKLLVKTMEMVRERGFTISNIDCSVVLEKPKLFSHIRAITERLSELLGCDQSLVSVKAKTKEGLDAAGEGRAVEAYAVALLEM